MKREDFEIMAPVGSYESLNAAISAHADAVYFGVEGLNMRSRSSMNFGLDDLKNISEICRNAGLKHCQYPKSPPPRHNRNPGYVFREPIPPRRLILYYKNNQLLVFLYCFE